ncbi:unnamed protein product [Polarella glacialis]|uniref:Helicase C-terminal domain-containing protein n=1 Tax=Polarella glacialis TaxID=89957 RepID=A0A813HG95_POLGL|nr:unnamed protein product [Polarella glacialis]
MRALRSEIRIALTGTPVQNNLSEFHSILEFICPGMFTEERFADAYDPLSRRMDASAVWDTRGLLEVMMLRRLKVDVEKGLPPKHEVRVNCPLSPMQIFWYRRLLIKDWTLLARVEKGEGNIPQQHRRLLSLVAQLRKVCDHPYLLDGAEEESESDALGAMVAASGKLALLDRLLVEMRAKGHRVMIFSQFTLMLDIIEDYMVQREWSYVRMDGSTSRVQRVVNIHQFQSGAVGTFLMSTRTGGLGINLQSADTVIFFDSDWNPQADRQAMARVHRIGQTKPVWVYRLVSLGTVEERILQRAETKLLLDASLLSEEVSQQETAHGVHALWSLIRTSVVGVATRILEDHELKKLLDRSQPPPAVSEGEAGVPHTELHDTFTLQGKNVPRVLAKVTSMKQIGTEWRQTQNTSASEKLVAVVRAATGSNNNNNISPVLKVLLGMWEVWLVHGVVYAQVQRFILPEVLAWATSGPNRRGFC